MKKIISILLIALFAFMNCKGGKSGSTDPEVIMKETVESLESIIKILESNKSKEDKISAIVDYKSKMDDLKKRSQKAMKKLTPEKSAKLAAKYAGKIMKLSMRASLLIRRLKFK